MIITSQIAIKKLKSLLFINGIPPKNLPKTEDYSLIACTDGAFHYLKEKNFPLEKLDFISGDFDSHCHAKLVEEYEALRKAQRDKIYKFEIIETPNQDKTDFQKALEILEEKNISEVQVYGGSGGEMDHFLGNLSVAFLFKERLKITFFDEFSTYFFSPKHLVLENVKDKMISLYPFPIAENISTIGLKWQLNNENLNLQSRIGTRNLAVQDQVEINFENGDLIIFLQH